MCPYVEHSGRGVSGGACSAHGSTPSHSSKVQLADTICWASSCCPGAAAAWPTHHVKPPLLQFEPAVDHRAYARVLHEAIRGGNHSLARVLISGASLDTLLMRDTQGRGFLHALGRVWLASSMLLQCLLLLQSRATRVLTFSPLLKASLSHPALPASV